MLTVKLHDAKVRLSELVDQAAKRETFIITKAGKPMVKVILEGELLGKAERIHFIKERFPYQTILIRWLAKRSLMCLQRSPRRLWRLVQASGYRESTVTTEHTIAVNDLPSLHKAPEAYSY